MLSTAPWLLIFIAMSPPSSGLSVFDIDSNEEAIVALITIEDLSFVEILYSEEYNDTNIFAELHFSCLEHIRGKDIDSDPVYSPSFIYCGDDSRIRSKLTSGQPVFQIGDVAVVLLRKYNRCGRDFWMIKGALFIDGTISDSALLLKGDYWRTREQIECDCDGSERTIKNDLAWRSFRTGGFTLGDVRSISEVSE